MKQIKGESSFMRGHYKTDKGIAAYCGDTSNYSILVHISPTPTERYYRDPDRQIDVLLAKLGEPDYFLGSIPLDNVVSSFDGMEFENGFALSAEECREIDAMCWDALIEDFGIAPEVLVESADIESD
jgi:hypothetical protein